MPITPEQAQEMIRRTEINSGRLKPAAPSECPADAAELEIEGLHEPLMKWCREQVPAVPFIRSRSDQPSTIGEGVHDFTLFYRKHTICIEWKSRTGKPKIKQLAWRMLMEAQGFTVHEWRSMNQFYEFIKTLE